MRKAETCLVTGGAGFIGCALSAELVARYERVVAFDILHQQVHDGFGRPARLDPGVEIYHADVADAAAWDRLLADVQPSILIHLAAETGTGQSLTEGARHAATNVLGTCVMFDAFARHKVEPRKVVLASSRAVYGEGAWQAGESLRYPGQRAFPQLEQCVWDFPGMRSVPSVAGATVPEPVSVYGATKLAQENLVKAWCNAFGVDYTILRFQNVYGPGQSLKNSYTGIINLFCRLARRGEALPIYEDGEMLRDFVFISDVADAVLQSLERPVTGPLDVGSGAAISLLQGARYIVDRYGSPAPVVTGKFRLGDVRHAACDIAATMAALAWQPKVHAREGFDRLMSWIDSEEEGGAA